MKKAVIQYHHISYSPEVVVALYKGEHYILTQMNRRKKVSWGFIKSLEVWIALNKDSAKDVGSDIMS